VGADGAGERQPGRTENRLVPRRKALQFRIDVLIDEAWHESGGFHLGQVTGILAVLAAAVVLVWLMRGKYPPVS
jgi:hypothetical protein